MKTFLPVISPSMNPWQTMRLSLEALDNKRLGKQRVESYQIWNVITGVTHAKAWRLAPAVHMWRGYEQALGVYIKLNCAIWASRISKSGKPFSNLKMEEHITRCKFGQNDAGVDVSLLAMPAATAQATAAAAAAADGAVTLEAGAAASPVTAAATSALTGAAATSPVPSVAIAAAAAAPVGAASAPGAKRSGTYVDGIRIPWWLHDRRVHDSDAGMLYRKDPTHYKAFAAFSDPYPEYVWPRDINPLHPEQKEELDVLNAQLAQEAAAKEAAKPAKKKQKGKRARDADTDNEVENVESDAEHSEGQGTEAVPSTDKGTVDEHAVLATPKRGTRASAAAVNASPVDASPVSSVPSRSSKRRRIAAAAATAATSASPAALWELTDEVLNSQTEDSAFTIGAESPAVFAKVQPRKRRQLQADKHTADWQQATEGPRTRRALKL